LFKGFLKKTVIIENPEAHLHPKGQSKVGELIGLAASCGVNLYVETHSDHVLNGIRICVKRKLLKPEDLIINYFKRNNNEHTAKISQIPINNNGGIDYWPEGFFDQMDNDFEILFRD
jgi:predicted ATPase